MSYVLTALVAYVLGALSVIAWAILSSAAGPD